MQLSYIKFTQLPVVLGTNNMASTLETQNDLNKCDFIIFDPQIDFQAKFKTA